MNLGQFYCFLVLVIVNNEQQQDSFLRYLVNFLFTKRKDGCINKGYKVPQSVIIIIINLLLKAQ